MARTILCPHCNSALNEDILKQRNSESTCLVCGKPLDSNASADEHSDWITWWYYGFKSDNGKTTYLSDKSIDLDEHGDTFFLIKEFKAPPESECGLDEVKKILRTYVPDAFAEPKEIPKVKCPYCFSSEIQIVPKKFSLLTGFATNKFERVCVRCKRKF